MELSRGERRGQRDGPEGAVALPERFIRGHPEHDHHLQQAEQEQHEQQHVAAEILLPRLWGDQEVGPADTALQGESSLETGLTWRYSRNIY